MLFAILQKYDFSSKSQLTPINFTDILVVCDTAKVRFFKQITTATSLYLIGVLLFAILQKYDFSSKSQQINQKHFAADCCLRYCKSTIFQANHNGIRLNLFDVHVVCDTAKVRFFKQITTRHGRLSVNNCCLRYCKSTIFQANHNHTTNQMK